MTAEETIVLLYTKSKERQAILLQVKEIQDTVIAGLNNQAAELAKEIQELELEIQVKQGTRPTKAERDQKMLENLEKIRMPPALKEKIIAAATREATPV